jgi:predicted nuclease with RNAse H fold
MKPILGVGWDVGGWCGSKQAVAAVLCKGHRVRWLGAGSTFSLPSLEKGAGLRGLIRTAWKRCPDDVFRRYRVVVAIDAPFRFPQGFVNFLSGRGLPYWNGRREIDNPLAYRACDQAVLRAFNGKKPLSASFDKLGNNTTVAMAYLRRWRRKDSARVLPFDKEKSGTPTIIEVYPALAKPWRKKTAHRKLRPLLRLADCGKPGSDEYDAALCALMAVGFAGASSEPDRLPQLVAPPDNFSAELLKSEGWIYYPSPSWLGISATGSRRRQRGHRRHL